MSLNVINTQNLFLFSPTINSFVLFSLFSYSPFCLSGFSFPSLLFLSPLFPFSLFSFSRFFLCQLNPQKTYTHPNPSKLDLGEEIKSKSLSLYSPHFFLSISLFSISFWCVLGWFRVIFGQNRRGKEKSDPSDDPSLECVI